MIEPQEHPGKGRESNLVFFIDFHVRTWNHDITCASTQQLGGRVVNEASENIKNLSQLCP